MMDALKETANKSRDNCIRMSINERLNDALVSINLAIKLYPIEAEFHLQRLKIIFFFHFIGKFRFRF
jgi:hypothetical protein